MSSPSPRYALVLVVLVIALGAAAATLDSGSAPSGTATPEPPPEEEPELGSGGGPTPERPAPATGSVIDPCSALLDSPPLAFALGALALGASALAFSRTRNPVAPALVLGPVGVGLVTVCSARLGSVLPRGLPSVHPVAILLAALALAVSVGYVVSGRRVETDEIVDESDDGEGGDVAAVGDAAGRAADRIAANADATNEVYRAWREMTRHLEVDNPDSSTPAEFAAAAVDAGMDRAHVEELTALFEEVRYGGKDASTREERAIEILRRIEAAYVETPAQ